MTGDAAQWFVQLEKNRGMPTWTEFERLVHQRFSPPLRGNALGQLIQLRRDSTVAEYQNKFLQLVNRCTNLSKKHQIDIFTAGLRNPLKTNVELEQPATLEEAMALAHACEQRLAMPEDTASRTSNRPVYSRPVTKMLTLPAPPPAMGGSTPATATPPSAPCLTRLTAAEMAAKRENGECYNCTEQFSWEHLKVCPMKGVFLLEMDTPEHMELDDSAPLISLNAITGIAVVEMMKLLVHIQDAAVTALVDSGSTHSFVSLDLACRLHLDPLFQPGLQVTVANGDKVASTGICKDIKFSIAGEEFVLDLFVIPLVGYEMVLGVHWLRMPHSLGFRPRSYDLLARRSSRCLARLASTRASAFTVAMTDLMATLL
jgi:hypothetical protein